MDEPHKPLTNENMSKDRPSMELSPDEELFLRHWMCDEVRYAEGVGPAKRLQLQHGATPADLATLIAAAIPNPADQEAAGHGPLPVETPSWPWSDDALSARLNKARSMLAEMRKVAESCRTASQRKLSPASAGG